MHFLSNYKTLCIAFSSFKIYIFRSAGSLCMLIKSKSLEIWLINMVLALKMKT